MNMKAEWWGTGCFSNFLEAFFKGIWVTFNGVSRATIHEQFMNKLLCSVYGDMNQIFPVHAHP